MSSAQEQPTAYEVSEEINRLGGVWPPVIHRGGSALYMISGVYTRRTQQPSPVVIKHEPPRIVSLIIEESNSRKSQPEAGTDLMPPATFLITAAKAGGLIVTAHLSNETVDRRVQLPSTPILNAYRFGYAPDVTTGIMQLTEQFPIHTRFIPVVRDGADLAHEHLRHVDDTELEPTLTQPRVALQLAVLLNFLPNKAELVHGY